MAALAAALPTAHDDDDDDDDDDDVALRAAEAAAAANDADSDDDGYEDDFVDPEDPQEHQQEPAPALEDQEKRSRSKDTWRGGLFHLLQDPHPPLPLRGFAAGLRSRVAQGRGR